MKKSVIIIFSLVFSNIANISSQENHQSFINKYYDLIASNNQDSARIITLNYLKKLKIEGDVSLEYLDLYMLLSETENFENGILYLDTIIALTKNKSNFYYPATAYFEKGGKYFDRRDYINSLDNYLMAYNEAKKQKNEHLEIISLNTIGIIKLERVGSEREAINIFQKCKRFYDKDNNISKHTSDYMWLLFSFSEAYRNIKKIDSSSYFNKFGHSELARLKKRYIKDYFTYSEGINESIRGNYQVSIDSLNKSIKKLKEDNDIGNTITSFYYYGKSYLGLNKNEIALEYFKKIDSLFIANLIYIPEIRLVYDYLKKDAIKNNELPEALKYIEKTLKLDSIYLQNFKVIKNTFKNEFNNKELQEEKQYLEKQLKKTNSNSKTKSYMLILMILIFATFYYFLNQKNKYYKNRFIEIVDNIDSKPKDIIIKSNKTKGLEIPKEITERCLKSLDKFEKEKGYLKQNLTTYSLSKIVGVNIKYLTNIIKIRKGKTFPNYINELRIGYTIKMLKEDSIFIKYTISSIAKEVGFSNTISFSQAFKKHTNLNPSFFIQEMIKSIDSENLSK